MENKGFDNIIRSELNNKAYKIDPKEEMLAHILSNIGEKQKRKNFNKYTASIICAVLLSFTGIFIFSPDIRAAAVDVIKTVFILDRSGVIVEKQADKALLYPGVGQSSSLPDSDLSKKLGVKVCFPLTLSGYKLQGKSESVGFTKPVDYNTGVQLNSKILEAINNEEAFKSLAEYKPFRSVQGSYKSNKGHSIFITINNTILPKEGNENITEKIPAKVGNKDATWYGFSMPDFKGKEITVKPEGKYSAHTLVWSESNKSFHLMDNSNLLSLDEALKIAFSFDECQK